MTGVQVRQLGLLGGLGAVLAIIIYVQSSGDSSTSAVSSAPSKTGNAAAPLTASPVVDVRLEALNAEPGEPPESERNPFRFRTRPAPPAEAAANHGGRGDRAAGPEPPVPPPAPPPRQEPQGPPPPPPIALRFIGIVDPAASDVRAAIFSDMRGNVFSGREGDIIEGRYRVLRVGPDAAELAYLDGRGRQTIRLSGQ